MPRPTHFVVGCNLIIITDMRCALLRGREAGSDDEQQDKRATHIDPKHMHLLADACELQLQMLVLSPETEDILPSSQAFLAHHLQLAICPAAPGKKTAVRSGALANQAR